MLKEAIQQIEQLAVTAEGVEKIDVEGLPHIIYKGEVKPLRLPLAKELTVRTLGGLVDYLKANRDDLDLSDLVVTVDNPGHVSVRGPALKDGRRALHLVAQEPDASAKFDSFVNRYMNVEDFIVGAQRHFRTGFGDLTALLAVVGNISQADVRQVEDDGVTQNVTTRAGITKVGSVPLPSPTMLCPRRSFAEVELALVPFIVRVRKAEPLPQIALFEADGDTWKIDAADKVRAFIVGEEYGEDATIPVPFGVLA